MKLIIGNKNYSTWSLRPWIFLKYFEIEFEEVRLPLFTEAYASRINAFSPNGKVPVLIDGDKTIWDSLAIVEYINDTYLDDNGWGNTKHWARSITAEMHSGFQGMREEMSMNCRSKRRIIPSEQTLSDVARVNEIWTNCRAAHSSEGDWLFGTFTIAVALYAPVALRMMTYADASDLTLSEQSNRYVDTVVNHPAIQAWIADSHSETEVIEHEDLGEEV